MHIEKEFEDDIKSDAGGNSGWADAMRKILQTKKPKRKKTIVLSKAKRLCDIKEKEDKESSLLDIEKIKEEVNSQEIKEEKDVVKKPQLKEKKLGIRVKPSIMDRERERTLQKIATKGVIQLFNAVKQQQGEINKKLSEAGPLERKREQVLRSIDKTKFLDVLMGGSKSISVDNDVKNEEQENEKLEKKKDKETWNVLREDFVMGTKLKDWDRKEQDEDSSAVEDMDSDD
ncbi:RRP15-like protein [Apis cerana]|uniref:RRP15-like protein n=1 Tax=Apis cerana cerana TaxID=94128 RepID=A0A2A3EH99_APICC|nr:RRP15-like protein [Apis cerana]XP_016904269.1 RRP15-like protein [Apis cerana]XP_061941218.1 RRP15-like protein [Apis cerana]PBC30844.1 RRP15 protein [Apis cerana cerana]